ncbi:Chitin synthase 2 [Smittium culicis]|uniref:Chitin synthase n=1 Tax=Smittium culicis TaxID=133412 RepID=A0A1R1YBP1_9FUNG|nr:Chitin synthase 2 [Smittium culicis]
MNGRKKLPKPSPQRSPDSYEMLGRDEMHNPQGQRPQQREQFQQLSHQEAQFVQHSPQDQQYDQQYQYDSYDNHNYPAPVHANDNQYSNDYYDQPAPPSLPQQNSYYRPLPLPTKILDRSGNPSVHNIELREPVSIENVSRYNENVEEYPYESKTPIDPRLMPQVDPELSILYDVSNAPPVDSRLYQTYQEQRMRNLKQVELTSGNLVVDCPVPDKVLKAGKFQNTNEFTHMRYTACTCDPNEFMNEKYTLRPVVYGRQTEIFIVLTMYNEDLELFNRTFKSMVKNITHLCSRSKSRTWGADSWKKVVVCVVSDGRSKIDKRVLNGLGCMGVYQEGVMQNSVSGKPVEAHIFEYTTQIYIDGNNSIVGPDKGTVPVQVLFCLKEKNAKKINSHRWFFNAFAPLLNPNVCVLIDVGTKPSGTSIYHLWKAFDKDKSVAGACGEICVDTGEGCCQVWNPLVAAQNFEYKMSNILDKPLESVFGYISVLPGAFSAYRYQALQNTTPNEGPLSAYFKGELMHTAEGNSGIFEANMYLAEDRILCFELVAKRNKNYVLRYVKSARAVTDVPDNLSELISQRRRWLNGSFFAMFYAIIHWYRMFSTSHNIFRKLLLFFEFIYQCVSMLFTWFSLANFYLAYYFLAQGAAFAAKNNVSLDPFFGYGEVVTDIIRILYIMALITMFILALGNRPQGSKFIYGFSVFIFAVIMVVLTYITLFGIIKKINSTDLNQGIDIFKDSYFRDIVISTASTYGLYLVASIIYLEPWHMITSFLQYILWVPSSINILMVYAFCNIHDVSWGTKGDTSVKNDLGHAKISQQKDGVQVAHIQIATDINDVNSNYENFLAVLRQPEAKVKQKRDATTKAEDKNKLFRTNLVLAWAFSNILLVMLLSSTWFNAFLLSKNPNLNFNPYLSFIFWSVAALSLIRFIGSLLYIIPHYLFGS